MGFGTRSLQALKNKGISQEELAKEFGTKGPAIGRYERKERTPSIEMVLKIAKVFDISLDNLVGDGINTHF